ncbi:MAG: lipoate--protein ligase family protein [Haloarculaceae archaeon]
MRVYRGRAATVEADRAVSERLLDRVAESRDPAVRVWRPHRHVAFGRRDANSGGYERARELAADHGFPPVERSVGGRAVAYTGRTVAFGRATPIADPRSGLGDRYDAAIADLRSALAALGVDAEAGEPPNSFCPGAHSLQATGPDGRPGKLVGIAQRVRRRVALVAGVLVVDDHGTIADVLDPVYDALGVAFDPSSVGSVALAGGECDRETVAREVESALVGDAAVSVERVDA